MVDPTALGFRPMTMSDLPLMHRWLQTPHVNEWWHEGRGNSLEGVIKKYAPRIRGEQPTAPYLILYGEQPIGYIQTYRIADWPDYARHVQADEVAAGLDLFNGESAYLHQGLGPHIIRRFLREVVFADPGVESCIIGPEPDNQAAIRTYARAGFRYLKTIQVPGEPAPEYLMRITRAECDS